MAAKRNSYVEPDLDELMGEFAWDDSAVAAPPGAAKKAPAVPAKKAKIDESLTLKARDTKQQRTQKAERVRVKINEEQTKLSGLNAKSGSTPADGLERIKLNKEIEDCNLTIKAYQDALQQLEGAVDTSGLDSSLDALMGEMSVVASDKVQKCASCQRGVGSDIIEMLGQVWHRGCAPTCVNCKRRIDPTEVGASSEKATQVAAMNDKLAKAEREKSALLELQAAKPAEAQRIAADIAAADFQINACNTKLAALNAMEDAPYVLCANNRIFHADCLVCKEPGCGERIPSDKYQMPGHQYGQEICKRHYFQYVGLICMSCNKPIDEEIGHKAVRVDEQLFHTQCFKCARCQKVLKGFKANAGKYYCTQCHTQVF